MNDKKAKFLRKLAKIAARETGGDWRYYYKWYKNHPLPPGLNITEGRKEWIKYLETRQREV